jgi:hypothetical protein
VRTHVLKTVAVYWDAMASGDKTFDVRRDDRGFQKGDLVELHRLNEEYNKTQVETNWDGKPKNVLVRRIRWILTGGQFGIQPGYVVLQLEPILNVDAGRGTTTMQFVDDVVSEQTPEEQEKVAKLFSLLLDPRLHRPIVWPIAFAFQDRDLLEALTGKKNKENISGDGPV